MRSRLFFTAFFWVGAITMLVMSVHYFQHYITGIIKNKTVTNALWYHLFVRTHIALGMIAMFVAPTQFSKKLRLRSIVWHRRFGYIYMVSVFLSSISGFIIAQFAMGGLPSRIGFTILSILWFIFTLQGLLAILKKDIYRHQLWMIRSFALTFSAIPLRLMLLIPLVFTSVEFLMIYKLASWICWIFNLAIAEWIIRRLKTSKTR